MRRLLVKFLREEDGFLSGLWAGIKTVGSKLLGGLGKVASGALGLGGSGVGGASGLLGGLGSMLGNLGKSWAAGRISNKEDERFARRDYQYRLREQQKLGLTPQEMQGLGNPGATGSGGTVMGNMFSQQEAQRNQMAQQARENQLDRMNELARQKIQSDAQVQAAGISSAPGMAMARLAAAKLPAELEILANQRWRTDPQTVWKELGYKMGPENVNQVLALAGVGINSLEEIDDLTPKQAREALMRVAVFGGKIAPEARGVIELLRPMLEEITGRKIDWGAADAAADVAAGTPSGSGQPLRLEVGPEHLGNAQGQPAN
jgi:hypothetical protein